MINWKEHFQEASKFNGEFGGAESSFGRVYKRSGTATAVPTLAQSQAAIDMATARMAANPISQDIVDLYTATAAGQIPYPSQVQAPAPIQAGMFGGKVSPVMIGLGVGAVGLAIFMTRKH